MTSRTPPVDSLAMPVLAPRATDEPTADRRGHLARGCRVAAALAIMIGALTLLGWAVGLRALTEIPPSNVALAVTTATCFVALGAAWQTNRRNVVLALTVLVGLICGLTVVEHISNTSLGVDQLFTLSHYKPADQPGPMSLASALGLLVLTACRLLVMRGWVRPVVPLVAIQLLFTEFVLLGYTYRIGVEQPSQVFSTFNLGTVVAMFALGIATWLAIPDGFANWVVRGTDAGAITVRRLAPIAVAVLPLLGYVIQRSTIGRHHGDNLGWALFVVTSALLVTVVTVRVAIRLAEVDRRRTEVVNQLRQLNSELEERVVQRTEMLQAERSRLAVFEERTRIAADLHDHVIQRLYGLALMLSSSVSESEDPRHTALLNATVDDIDFAIRELRTTIFAIKQPVMTAGVVERLRTCIEDASRLLGHMPAFTVHGEPERIGDSATVELEAVLREALSNVVRHAHAESTGIVLTVDSDCVQLVVQDDGVGMDPQTTTHASGTANISARAQRLGGTAEWSQASPHGTRLTWQIPIRAE